MTGVFITLEGGEGVGKSTQAALLGEALRERGRTVVVTREPGGTPGAEAIRALLTHGSVDRWDARTEALLFAAARADHVARVIAPALERGDWVVCDRFIDSTRVYQGGDFLSDADILVMHALGSSGLMPDRTLLLTLDAPRTGGRDREDRLERRGTAEADRITAGFLRFADAEPHRIRAIDASGEPRTVTARLLNAIEDLL